MTSAAAIGRPGEVEPFAAALALALRRQTRARAATIALIGGELPETEAASGFSAARRLAARAEAQELVVVARGRLAWVRLDAEDPRLVSIVRRLTLIAAPAVLAVATARTPRIDQALAERDLIVVVSSDPDGPLAQLSAAGLGEIPVVPVPRLARGPATALARAGIHSPRSVRRLLTELTEGPA